MGGFLLASLEKTNPKGFPPGQPWFPLLSMKKRHPLMAFLPMGSLRLTASNLCCEGSAVYVAGRGLQGCAFLTMMTHMYV